MTERGLTSDLSTINLSDLRQFVVSAGFSHAGPWGKYLERYHCNKGGRGYDILIPTIAEIADYDERISEALSELGRALEKQVSHIVKQLGTSDYSIFRLCAHPGTQINSLPFDEGAALLSNSKSLIKASAISAFSERHKKVIRGRNSAIVDRYMEKIRIGQSGLGSYIFNILLPNGIGMFEANDVDQNSDSVVESLHRKFCLAAEMSRSKRVPASEKLEEAGMSANFCDSLYEIIDWSENISIEIDINNMMQKRTIFSYNFDRTTLSVLEKTSTKLSPDEQPNEITLHGTITRLSEPASKRRGSIDLLTKIREKRRSVRIAFEADDRDTIISAFKEKSSRLLTVSGQLRTERNGHLVLDNPFDFDASKRGTLL